MGGRASRSRRGPPPGPPTPARSAPPCPAATRRGPRRGDPRDDAGVIVGAAVRLGRVQMHGRHRILKMTACTASWTTRSSTSGSRAEPPRSAALTPRRRRSAWPAGRRACLLSGHAPMAAVQCVMPLGRGCCRPRSALYWDRASSSTRSCQFVRPRDGKPCCRG